LKILKQFVIFNQFAIVAKTWLVVFIHPSDLKLYSDGYLQALRNCSSLEQRDQDKLERLIERWILDPSSFIEPGGDENKGFFDKKKI